MLYELKSVSLKFDGRLPALSGINLSINRGDTILINGRSGSGKTSLLRLLCGEIRPDFGRVFYKGEDMSKFHIKSIRLLRQLTGIIFQQPELISTANLLDNVMIGAMTNRNSGVIAKSTALKIISELKISHLRRKFPSQLSVGERKLAMAARAIAKDPEIIIADEPGENLDDISKKLLYGKLREFEKSGKTLIIATNDAMIDEFFDRSQKVQLIDGKIDLRYK